MKLWTVLLLLLFFSCSTIKLKVPPRTSQLTGTGFYKSAASFNWKQRDSFALSELYKGNIPSFLLKFVPVEVQWFDSSSQKLIRAKYFVSPDYLGLGTGQDWARINITPLAAQKFADSLGCFLPTRKMVDDIYKTAEIKLEPVPMYAYRDSTPTMYQHHLIIEGQRKNKKGLIAGIKKDVVITGKLIRDGLTRSGEPRVAIYGWHKPGGQPIQPLYTGHVYWWVDYSQGIRLVYRKIKVNGKWLDYTDVLKDPVLRRLLCDEEYCDFYKYPY
ncbi:MAG TPA: hypothetical protein VGC29_11860 [Flavisolibacter sp.]